MATLGELAKLIRSKNAGAFVLTFDVMFEDEATYRRVLDSKVLTRQSFAKLYKMSENEVMFFEYDAACAIKISIPRPYIQGDLDDGDMYGGQQHALLVDLVVPD
jgi:CRISPR/Cas system-associated protein Cas5 (RAMP superfamily)